MKKPSLKLMVAFAFVAMAVALPISVSIKEAYKTIPMVTVHQTSAFAQEAVQDPAPAQADAGKLTEESATPTWFDKILAFIAGSGGILGGLALGAEVLFRLIPTKKPLSLLRPAHYACTSLVTIFAFLANVLNILISAANNSQQSLPITQIKKNP